MSELSERVRGRTSRKGKNQQKRGWRMDVSRSAGSQGAGSEPESSLAPQATGNV